MHIKLILLLFSCFLFTAQAQKSKTELAGSIKDKSGNQSFLIEN